MFNVLSVIYRRMPILGQLHKIIKLLDSDATPLQIALGFALGSIFALTPLRSWHNLFFLLLLFFLNVSLKGALLSFGVLKPISLLFTGIYNGIGLKLLTDSPDLVPVWTKMYNMPLVPWTRFNNTYVLGSLVFSLCAFVPLAVTCYVLVRFYRSKAVHFITEAAWYKAFRKTAIGVLLFKILKLLPR